MAVLTSNYPTSLDTTTTLGEVSNRAKTTLAVALANTGETEISLTDASLFPNSGAVSIDNEIFYYSSKSTNVLTIESRANQGTSAASHLAGALVYLRLTKGHYEVLRTAIINLETKIGIGSTNAASAGTNSILTHTGSGTTTWQALSDLSIVTGPGSSIDNSIPRFDGTTGKIIQTSSNIGINDSGHLGVGTVFPSTYFEVAPPTVTGTASQTGTTVTATSGIFTSDMVNSYLIFANGTVRTITGYTSTTVVTVNNSGTVASQAISVNKKAISVSAGGTVAIGATSVPTGAKFYVFGGSSGANFDIRADGVGTDQAILELQNADYESTFASMYFYNGGTSASGTTGGFTNVNLGAVLFQSKDNALIATIGAAVPLTFGVNGTREVEINSSATYPYTNDGNALGTTTNMWSDLFLASGAVINFNNGDVTLTHSADTLTLGGGTLALGSNSLTMTGSIAATGARVTKGWFTDIESTNMPTVGGTSLSSTFSPIAGSASIVTVGTITSGTWQGGVISSTYGGTGVNNGGRTLAINTNSGTIAFSNASKTVTFAHSITFSGTDSTTMTFPTTSATIARTDAAQTFTGTQTFSSTISGNISGNAATVTTIPSLSGDVTSSGNTVSIGAGKVTFAMLATAAWSDDTTLAGDSSTVIPTVHAVKTYADNLIAGLKFKANVRVASTANVTISSAPAAIDGVTLSNGDRVLLKNQSTGAENGIYIFNGTGSAMTRATDADTGSELASKTIPVTEGTANADTWWTIIEDSITLNTTAITFTQTAGTGTYTNGAGLSLTGNSFSISTGGVTNAMLAGSIAASKLVGTDITTVGTITSGAWQSDVISPTYGGTGVDNADRTLTIITSSGVIEFADAYTLTVADNASVSGTNTGDQTSVSGNAGTATALQTPRTIGGVSFDGTANITVASATGGFTVSGGNLALGTNSITMTGSIAATGARVTKGWFTDIESTNMITVGGTSLSSTFSPIAGSASITTVGTIGSGTWQGSVISSTYGGTGVNNGGRTLTISTSSGTIAFAAASKTITFNKTMSFNAADDTGTYTLPTGTKTLVATDVTSLSSLATVGTISSGTWQGSVISSTYGGTGVNNGGRTLTINTNSGIIAFSNASKTITFANTLTFAGTDSTTMTFPSASSNIGYLETPQNSQSAAYTLVLSDSGKQIFHPSADTTARTWTIPANSSVAFPVGTAVTFVNQNGAGVITIAITTDTLRLASAGTTGSRTLAANGIATALKVTSTEWIISGTGLS